jgi:hypothetical protein
LCRRALLAVLLLPLLLLSACSRKAPSNDGAPAPSSSSFSATAVPPVAPISDFLDATAPAPAPDGQTPYEQARAHEANGQYWLARLMIEKKALSADGTKDEVELLARICQVQGDEACVDECGKKLGRKLTMDAGLRRAAVVAQPPSADVRPREPENDFARARQLLLEGKYKDARKILEPKVLDGKASAEEIRMLKAVCKEEGDRMCMALCDAKLK